MRTTTGLSTEAVYIFNNMLRKLAKTFDPEYMAAIFESGEPTHRDGGVRRVQGQPHRNAARPGRPDSLRPRACWKPCAFRFCSTRASRRTT